jgi:hypothetical protein
MIHHVADHPSSPAAGSSPASDHQFVGADDVRKLLQPIEQWIIRYPAAALASALVVGVAVAWWIKRK